MENKVLSILLGGLIVAVIFHALAFRYEMRIKQGSPYVYRIDRLTGRLWSCFMFDAVYGKPCEGGAYNDTTPMKGPKK